MYMYANLSLSTIGLLWLWNIFVWFPLVPPGQPTNLRSSNIGPRRARLTWQAPNVVFSNSLTQIQSYRVTASQSNFAIADVVIDTESDGSSYMLQGNLEEHTRYICTVRAKNSFGFGPNSLSIQFTTSQAGSGVNTFTFSRPLNYAIYSRMCLVGEDASLYNKSCFCCEKENVHPWLWQVPTIV